MSSKGQQVVSDLPDLIGNDGSKASRKDTTDDSGQNLQSMQRNKESGKCQRPKSSIDIRNEKSFTYGLQRTIAWSPGGYDGSTYKNPKGKIRQRISRPTSAPADGMSSRRSSMSSESSSSFGSFVPARMRRQKPLYKQPSKVVSVRAFVNGDQDKFIRVTAPNLKQLLELCTTKLNLVTAARKVFLSDGTLVKDFHQIKRNADVYISCGEPFKNPFGKYIEKERLSQMSTWTMNGIIFPESNTRGRTKPLLSKRMRDLVEKQRKRILVFQNETYSGGKEIVASTFEEFLGDCTERLEFQTRAKCLYDWEGKEITQFSQVPMIDNVVQPAANAVIGPLWVTRGGERFSFKGPYGFVDTLLETAKERLKEARNYESQLQSRLENISEGVSVEVLSFTEQEAKIELEQVSKTVHDLEAVIPKLKTRKKRLASKKQEEEAIGANNSSYKFQNISEIEEDSRLLGKKGIRLKVYENGKIDDEVVVYFNIYEASKGVSSDRNVLLGRLLDTIAAQVMRQGYGPAGRPLARRIYKDNGAEVLDVHELETDQCIWLSYGEKFISPYTYALHASFEKTKCISLWNEKKIIQREILNEDDVYGKDRAGLWRAVESYPSDCKYDVVEFEMEEQQRVSYARGLQHSQIRENNTFLQSKNEMDLVLIPDVSVEKKMPKGDNSMWPSDCQQWLIHKSGHITCRSFPQLCLRMSNIKVKVDYHEGTSPEGFVLKFAKRSTGDLNQIWKFTTTGDICNETNPSLVLTWIANENHQVLRDDDRLRASPGEMEGNNCSEENKEAIVETLSTMGDFFGGEKQTMALLPKLPAKHTAIGTQRWAIKQESLNNMGQWKFSQIANPAWNRRALSWPVSQDGNLIEEFNWPMEGFLICNAPPVKRKEASNIGPPVRLRVLKNGEHDLNRAVTVVGPDLGNMARDIGGKSSIESTKTRKTSHLPSSRNDIQSLELNLFLDRCTDALRLPFAARRVFDEQGSELFTLRNLERNQLVFVSCGESWLDFNVSQSDQQRRRIISNLSSDIDKLRLYCQLRNPQGLVLTVGGTVAAGSGVSVATCELIDEGNDNNGSGEDVHNSQSDNSIEGIRSSLLSAHERAHVKSDERIQSLKWPWETAITSNGEVNIEAEQYGDFEHDIVYSDNRLHKRYRHHTAKSLSSRENVLLSCQWLYNEGWIQLRNNNQLVLGIAQDSSEDKLVSEVYLSKKKMDDVNQRWTISSDGTIHLYNNANATLTVSDPGRTNDGYDGSSVLVMPRKPCNGNANQLWLYDHDSGLISAFAGDAMNLEITAANKAGICTRTLLGDKSVSQIGYSMQNGASKMYLCKACGIACRGKYILQKLEQSENFACDMGKDSAKEEKSSCFKCLTNEVDLTSQEADATLAMWEHQLKGLRKITSIRSLNKEIQAAQSESAVRIRAYKNGDGIRKQPVLVIGSTIDSLLDQCTTRLSLSSAARRLYNIDGELITDIDQLRGNSGTVKRSPTSKKAGKNTQRGHEEQQRKDAVDEIFTANDCSNDSIKDNTQVSKKMSGTNIEGCDGKNSVDVFVSCGETFVPLEDVEKQYLLEMKHQYARNWVENHLETEKHILRQIQGRRIAARSSIEPRSWQDLTKQEEVKQDNIEELTEHLRDLKTKQQQEKEHLTSTNVPSKRTNNTRLYDASKTVRIDVFENGDAERRCVSVCGSSLMEILKICTCRLGLPAAARRFFTTTGDEIGDVSELVKGEIYCVSCGENFTQPKDRQSVITRKATWSRLNRQTGGAMAYKSHEKSPRSSSIPLVLATSPNFFNSH